MATPESKTKAKVRKMLDAAGAYYFMPPANGYGRAGILDFAACINGHFLAVECKAGKGTTTALQDRELLRISAAGGTALVVWDTEGSYLRLTEAITKALNET